MRFSPPVYTFLCGVFASFGSVLFGYDLGVISSVLTAPDFLRVTGLNSDSAADANYIGFIVASMLLGAFVASIPAGLAADRFSRRVAITIGAIIFLVGGILQTAAQNKEMMLAGRFFAGMGIGQLVDEALLAPLYQSEIAHPANRGRLTALQQFMLGLGAVVAGWIGYGCDQHALGKPLQWRLPVSQTWDEAGKPSDLISLLSCLLGVFQLGLQNLPAIPLLFIVFLLPESPRWLMKQGRAEEALQVLAQLHSSGDTDDDFVQAEWREMRAKVEEESKSQQGWLEMVQNPQTIRKVMLGIILQFSVQMTGVSAIQYYSPTVFRAVGFTTSRTLLIQALNNVNGLIAEGACIAFLDRFGRRQPLIWANVVAGVCFAIATGLARNFAVAKGSYGQGVAFVAMTFIFNFAFSCAVGPISWAYPVEIMNTSIRAKGTALSSMAAWIANFMIGQVSPIAFRQIGWRFYILFAVCGFSNALTVWALFPETKAKTLEQMDDYFVSTSWIVPLNRTQLSGGNAEPGPQNDLSAEKGLGDEKRSVSQVEYRA